MPLMRKIWKDCIKCHGDGLVWATGGVEGVDPIDLGNIPPPIGTPEQMTCPLYKGEKRFVWGWQETNPMEAP